MMAAYSAQDVKDMVEDYLHAQAEAWREEGRLEGLRGAGDRNKINTLTWGADRLDAMASQIHRMPMEEELHPDEAALVDDGSQPKQVSDPQIEVEDLGAPQNPEPDEHDALRFDDKARVEAELEDAQFEEGELDAKAKRGRGKKSD